MAIKVIDVPGIGPKTAEYLAGEGLTTAEDLVQAGVDELMKAPGFHQNRANTVLDAARGLIVEAEVETAPAGEKAKKEKAGKTKKNKKQKKEKKQKKIKKDKDSKKKKEKKEKKKKKKG